MVAERLVAYMQSLRGWKYCAAEWLGWITETVSNDRVLLVEVADVADVQVRKSDFQIVADVEDVITAPDLTKLSRSWCAHDTLGERLQYNHLESLSCCGARVVQSLFRQCVHEHVRPRASCLHSVI